MKSNDLSVMILAAGKGTRMNSSLPKVLHPVAGEPMLLRTLNAVKTLSPKEIRVVVGYGKELVEQAVMPLGIICKEQKNPMGTADAVRAAEPETFNEEILLILNGDHPLIDEDDLTKIFEEFKNSSESMAVVTSLVDDPNNLGRIVRHKDQVEAIVEAKDASPDTLEIKEINTGIYLIQKNVLLELLPQISNDNAQKEFYITDLVRLMREKGKNVLGIQASENVAVGVNSQSELSQATKSVFKKNAHQMMENGVVIIDPENVYIESGVTVGSGTVVYPGVHLRGKTQIGSLCLVEPNCLLTDSKIEDGVVIKAGSYLESAHVGERTELGPYARLRPDSKVEKNCKIGNFVELKKVHFKEGAKASHLTYLGDAEIGENTNIGCGTITCNYAADKKKYKTIIGKNAFIGSDTQFIAPVEVGDGAIVGSGSTVTKNVPEGALAVARGRQSNIEGYAKKYIKDK